MEEVEVYENQPKKQRTFMPVGCSIDQLQIFIRLCDLWRIITENGDADTSQYTL